ncbi:MAG: PIN domain-containing protein [Alphaproteobacteria bacterium]
MADVKRPHLLIDTSYLRKVGFGHPDLQKLLRFSAEDRVGIFIPRIVWEERRTQLVEGLTAKAEEARRRIDDLRAPTLGGIPLQGLTAPIASIWTNDEIDAESRAAMEAFAIQSKIQVLEIAPDHADRAWKRYFEAAPPFNPGQSRENRRKDIPDSWILESAIDLLGQHGELYALCDDGGLGEALTKAGVRVFKDAQNIVDVIDNGVVAVDVVETPSPEPEELRTGEGLDAILMSAQERIKDLEIKVLGYVGYLGVLSKEQLLELLASGGVQAAHAQSIAGVLTMKGLIRNTGHHYIPENKEACAAAAILVEPELIKLLDR